MSRLMLVTTALALLAGCEPRPAAAPDPCQSPALAAPTDPAGTPDGETERLTLCIKSAVRDLDRAGGPVEAAAKAAVVRCAPEERAKFAAMAHRDRIYQWEKDEMHNRLQHVALVDARQTRSRGCGRPDGAPEEP